MRLRGAFEARGFGANPGLCTCHTERGEARSTTRHPTQDPRPGEAPDWLKHSFLQQCSPPFLSVIPTRWPGGPSSGSRPHPLPLCCCRCLGSFRGTRRSPPPGHYQSSERTENEEGPPEATVRVSRPPPPRPLREQRKKTCDELRVLAEQSEQLQAENKQLKQGLKTAKQGFDDFKNKQNHRCAQSVIEYVAVAVAKPAANQRPETQDPRPKTRVVQRTAAHSGLRPWLWCVPASGGSSSSSSTGSRSISSSSSSSSSSSKDARQGKRPYTGGEWIWCLSLA
jgi:hypothetical protein